MSENAKTITIVSIGMLAIVIGLLTRPSSADLDEETLVNTDLTRNFNSVDEAKRLRIVRFDEDTATRREFEVAEQDNGLWSIPSKEGYPADATQQMAEAATSLMDRKILQVASHSASDHEGYGVVDPSSPKLEPGQKGVGTRVTMYNEQNDALVDLIIGKAVKDAEGQRYVREAGRDIVYVIEIDRGKLSTNFEDWIEKDLLKLNAFDLAQVDIKDYSAALVQVMGPDGPTIGIDRDDRGKYLLGYNDTDAKWSPIKLQSFDRSKGENGEYVDFTLAADEELNDKALNDLKTALDDLQIVDVVRKPAGLSEDLKAGAEFVTNQKVFIDLATKGFTATGMAQGGPTDIISSDGEVIATTKNGAEYVLRFGNLTNVGSGEKAEDAAAVAAATDAKSGEKKSADDVHRYMFVMARFNEQAVKQPEFQVLPELPAATEATPAADAAAPEATPPGEAPATPASPPAEGEADTPASPEGDGKAETPAAAAADGKSETPPAETEPGAKNEDAKEPAATETPAADADADAKKADDDAKKADDAATKANPELEKIMAERKRIEQENQRKNDEYQETKKKGMETVKELNRRFGDWYFVVDDDVFKKVRLGRAGVIKKKEVPKAEGQPPAGTTTPAPEAGAAPAGLPEIPGAAE